MTKDDYRSTLHAAGWRRNADGKLTHPQMVAAWKQISKIIAKLRLDIK